MIIHAPHPGVFGKLLAADAAQQKASSYMLMFRGGQAEQTLSEDNYSRLVRIVLGEGLQKGIYTEGDKAAYIKAWSQLGALTRLTERTQGVKLQPHETSSLGRASGLVKMYS